jgi:hypothetical protein
MRITRSLALATGGIAAAATLTAVGGAEAADLINGHLIEAHSVALGKLTPGAVERLQGQRGPRGLRGPMGHNGLNGANGAQGLPGPAGNQGPVGPTGTAGAGGAPGAPGAQGPQGPAGAPGQSVTTTPEPAGANCATGGVKLTAVSGTSYICNGSGSTTVYTTANAPFGDTVFTEASAEVTCPSGFATGGGGYALDEHGAHVDLAMIESVPKLNGAGAPVGWSVMFYNADNDSVHAVAWAVCAQ